MDQTYTVVNARSGAVLASSLTLAHDSRSRRKGWLGLDSAPAGAAIWINPCEAVHCFFMRFTIDVLFLDRHLRVVKTKRSLRPWRISGCLPAQSVIELPEGVIESSGTAVGDQIVIQKTD